MAAVVIGVDPHKGSHTAVVIEVSSGNRTVFRLSLRGNRRLSNSVLSLTLTKR
jgi:hypothetical protein